MKARQFWTMKICPLKVSTIALERVDRPRGASGLGRPRVTRRQNITVPNAEAQSGQWEQTVEADRRRNYPAEGWSKLHSLTFQQLAQTVGNFMLAWKMFQSILGALEPRERTWHGERPESVTEASQSSVWWGEAPRWEEWWGTGLFCSAMTQNLHAALICLNAQGWAQVILFLIQTWLPEGAPLLRSSSVAQSTQAVRLGHWLGKKRFFLFPLTSAQILHPLPQCPDSLRLKKVTLGKTVHWASQEDRIPLPVLLY